VCKYESLIDGTLGLEDIALMNDALAVGRQPAAARRIVEQQNGSKHRHP
jgi:hypothetical protein